MIPLAMVRLTLAYVDATHLAAHLEQVRTQGALLVPLPAGCDEPQQFQPIELQVELPEGGGELVGEVLQVIPGLGVAVALRDPVAAYALTRGAGPGPQARPPTVVIGAAAASDQTASDQPEDAGPDVSGEGLEDGPPGSSGPRVPRGSSAVSWPIEKLQAEWQDLPLAERIRVARHGARPARIFVMRLQDAQMHQFLLSNPHVSAEEVTILSGMGNLDPMLLKRITSSQEWLRHTGIVRNLICHPKATMQQVTRLMDKLPSDELRRLTRTGKVRASVKRLLIKKLEQREGR